jgi:hypothetical protein
MTRRTPRIRFTSLVQILAASFLLAALSGCQNNEAPAPQAAAPKPAAPQAAAPQAAAPQAAAPQAAAPQAAAPQAQFRVTHVDLGSAIGPDKKVAAPSVTFKPSDTIYASVLSEGIAPTAALAVRWTYEDGQVVNEATQSIAPTGPAVTEFHIAKADGWPAGKYQVQVSANGAPVETLQFTVTD